ncbi:MAG: ribosome small subunit-dependent GTPase A [Treponema sp.]|jgi:ribosome biogenesis GTPase|nr:ribosome small subunit-dependent GTPase A [Treponema sp.]
MKGLVTSGSRNIFTVSLEHDPARPPLECRIKGKILKDSEGFYNPLAPGDRVSIEAGPPRSGTGMILSLEKRRSVFTRFNQKGGAPQILAANVDIALLMTSPASPPFRPRFLDRALLQADAAGLEAFIVCNKYDLGADPDVEERLEDFIRIGYRVLRVSAKTRAGLSELRALIDGKSSVLVGQSGTGKSSLINALLSASKFRVGAINEKYDRGNHTTTMAVMVELPPGRAGAEAGGFGAGEPGPGGRAGTTRLIDTPGIRRFVPDGIKPGDIIFHLREFAPLAGTCTYGLSCSHRTEPGCKIMEAVSAGVIHEDRYESFLRIRDELSGGKYAD